MSWFFYVLKHQKPKKLEECERIVEDLALSCQSFKRSVRESGPPMVPGKADSGQFAL